jgi:hypothetical protein
MTLNGGKDAQQFPTSSQWVHKALPDLQWAIWAHTALLLANSALLEKVR